MKPLTLSAHEVRAVLDGTKTQHWMPLRNPEYYGCPTGDCPHNYQAECNAAMMAIAPEAVGHSPGDQIWVREACYIAPVGWTDSPVNPKGAWHQEVAYAADDRSGYTKEAARDYGLKLRGAVTMPRWASRITLDVTGVRVCRVHDVTEDDAIACGMTGLPDTGTSRPSFRNQWTARHGPASWDANGWCAVVDFERRG